MGDCRQGRMKISERNLCFQPDWIMMMMMMAGGLAHQFDCTMNSVLVGIRYSKENKSKKKMFKILVCGVAK